MKKILVICTTIILFLCGMFVVEADECPCINLPEDPVTMIAEDGAESYFDIYLSGIPDGYDITNGFYLGWCVDRSTAMPRGEPHEVMLYCSYDPEMPDSFQDDDWDKVNYILNNKQGDKDDVQDAIWNLIDNKPYADITPVAQDMVDSAEDGFCPSPGDILAILADGGTEIQRSIFEFPLPPYGGLTPGFWKNQLH